MIDYGTVIMPVEEFILQHEHISYCEAIIYPNGNIEYAYPSHMEALIRVCIKNYKIDRAAIYEEMPCTASPLHWLIDKASCMSIWFRAYIPPKDCTPEQVKTLFELIDAGVMSKDLKLTQHVSTLFSKYMVES